MAIVGVEEFNKPTMTRTGSISDTFSEIRPSTSHANFQKKNSKKK